MLRFLENVANFRDGRVDLAPLRKRGRILGQLRSIDNGSVGRPLEKPESEGGLCSIDQKKGYLIDDFLVGHQAFRLQLVEIGSGHRSFRTGVHSEIARL